MPSSVPLLLTLAALGPQASDLDAKVKAIFDDACTGCHSEGGDPEDPSGLNLEVEPRSLLAGKSAANGKPFVVPGEPDESYLLDKIVGKKGIKGDAMPQDDDPLPKAQLDTIRSWISGLTDKDAVEAKAAASGGGDDNQGGGKDEATGGKGDTEDKGKKRGRQPFHGTSQIVLPTTTTLGKRTLQYRIDHRFGRIGTERGAFGLDAGVIMSFGLAYGIIDGLDVQLRRSNSRKDWELGAKYVPLRQEAGFPVSLGYYASIEWLRDFTENVANPWAGNVVMMFSRLWLDRWSTMLTVSYHFNTNHNKRVFKEKDGDPEPELVEDKRGTLDIGLASTVWIGKRKRWGIDLEWVLPIPDGSGEGDLAKDDIFYYRGGDVDPDGTKIGNWAIGASHRIGLHFFQVFFTNNREIHTNLWAPGGQTKNPFKTPGVDRAINQPNFFLGFNLARKFKL